MMRDPLPALLPAILIVTLALVAPASLPAQSAPDGEAARIHALNADIKRKNDAIFERNRIAQETYEKERAAHAAALAANAREVEAARLAAERFAAANAAHEADMARWRAAEAARTEHRPPPRWQTESAEGRERWKRSGGAGN